LSNKFQKYTHILIPQNFLLLKFDNLKQEHGNYDKLMCECENKMKKNLECEDGTLIVAPNQLTISPT
jgi:predicted ATP-grasp superfamily ATP-dependent carboligase